MFAIKELKIRFEFLKHSIESIFPSFWWFSGFIILMLLGVFFNWVYETEEGIIATIQSLSVRQGYGTSRYIVHITYEKDSVCSNAVIELPPKVSISEGEKIIINKHFRYIFRHKYSFSRKIRNNLGTERESELKC